MGAKRAPFIEIFALSRLTCFTGMHDSISRHLTILRDRKTPGGEHCLDPPGVKLLAWPKINQAKLSS
jgi:hypothetical protein